MIRKMIWKKVLKSTFNSPTKGTYKDWKEPLADEADHQCVYCAIHDALFGGIRNFHVEHYRPKAPKRFPQFENTYNNLFYVCPICNSFKGDDWPADPVADYSINCYPDPSLVNYSDLFDVDNITGLVTGKFCASMYIVEKINLNRPQLVIERKMCYLTYEISLIIKQIRQLIKRIKEEEVSFSDSEISDIYDIFSDLYIQYNDLRDTFTTITPYTKKDIER